MIIETLLSGVKMKEGVPKQLKGVVPQGRLETELHYVTMMPVDNSGNESTKDWASVVDELKQIS